jgi:hypothetical protein
MFEHTQLVPVQVLLWQTIKQVNWGTVLPLT